MPSLGALLLQSNLARPEILSSDTSRYIYGKVVLLFGLALIPA